MSFVFLIVIGLLVGWAATELTPFKHPATPLINSVIGIIGALIGGSIFESLNIVKFGFSELAGASMFGAAIFLTLVKYLSTPRIF